MSINDKIKQILIDKNLTPSYFADEIGVQRSSISHILSGRNRPSFDIIQKIIRRFPDLGYDWIMEDDSSSSDSSFTANRSSQTTARAGTERVERNVALPYGPSSAPVGVGVRSQRDEIPPVSTPASGSTGQVQPTANTSGERKVERILIFYTDGSFQEYKPSA